MVCCRPCTHPRSRIVQPLAGQQHAYRRMRQQRRFSIILAHGACPQALKAKVFDLRIKVAHLPGVRPLALGLCKGSQCWLAGPRRRLRRIEINYEVRCWVCF